MAGNGDSEIVCGARAGDGARRFRRSDAPGDFGVGDSVAGRNVLERLPHALLEGCAADVEREMQSDARHLNKADNLCNQGLVIAIGADETCFRKAILDITNEFFGIVAEQDRCDALLA
jgi:hypothetical protein